MWNCDGFSKFENGDIKEIYEIKEIKRTLLKIYSAKPYKRCDRLAEQIKLFWAMYFKKRLICWWPFQSIITITRVDVSPDLDTLRFSCFIVSKNLNIVVMMRNLVFCSHWRRIDKELNVIFWDQVCGQLEWWRCMYLQLAGNHLADYHVCQKKMHIRHAVLDPFTEVLCAGLEQGMSAWPELKQHCGKASGVSTDAPDWWCWRKYYNRQMANMVHKSFSGKYSKVQALFSYWWSVWLYINWNDIL